MAIQNRRGAYSFFNPDKMFPGEWAVILSGDPVVTDGKSAFICFSPGDVKRIATHSDMVDQFNDMKVGLITEITNDVNAATANAEAATQYANSAGASASAQSQAAEAAANAANAIADLIEQKLQDGDLTGPQGPAGVAGNNGAVVTLDGQYAFQIESDGHLYLYYNEGTTVPNLSIDEDGHLILTIEEV